MRSDSGEGERHCDVPIKKPREHSLRATYKVTPSCVFLGTILRFRIISESLKNGPSTWARNRACPKPSPQYLKRSIHLGMCVFEAVQASILYIRYLDMEYFIPLYVFRCLHGLARWMRCSHSLPRQHKSMIRVSEIHLKELVTLLIRTTQIIFYPWERGIIWVSLPLLRYGYSCGTPTYLHSRVVVLWSDRALGL